MHCLALIQRLMMLKLADFQGCSISDPWQSRAAPAGFSVGDNTGYVINSERLKEIRYVEKDTK